MSSQSHNLCERVDKLGFQLLWTINAYRSNLVIRNLWRLFKNNTQIPYFIVRYYFKVCRVSHVDSYNLPFSKWKMYVELQSPADYSIYLIIFQNVLSFVLLFVFDTIFDVSGLVNLVQRTTNTFKPVDYIFSVLT